MFAVEHTIVRERRVDPVHLYALGDWHVGARMCDMEAIEEWCDRILHDPFGHVILMGDMIDAIGITDKRYDGRGIHPAFRSWVDEDLIQRETMWCCDTLLPLAKAGKIVAILAGNHEETVRSRTLKASACVDPHYDLCQYLRSQTDHPINDLGYCGFVRVRLACGQPGEAKSVDNFTVFATHGFGGGRKPGGHANALDDALDAYLADLTLMAHRHQFLALSKTRIGLKQRGKPCLVKHEMKACQTGTFLKTSSLGSNSYSEKALYKPTKIGGAICRIRTKHPGPRSANRSRLEIAVEV